jgi:hypothetical protein
MKHLKLISLLKLREPATLWVQTSFVRKFNFENSYFVEQITQICNVLVHDRNKNVLLIIENNNFHLSIEDKVTIVRTQNTITSFRLLLDHAHMRWPREGLVTSARTHTMHNWNQSYTFIQLIGSKRMKVNTVREFDERKEEFY